MRDHPHRGVLATVAMLGVIFLIGGIVRWQPLASALTEHYPTSLAYVTTGSWFLVCALSSIQKPYSGVWLIAGSIVALPLILGFLGAAAGSESYRGVSLAFAVFTAAGLLLMNAARSAAKKLRRSWLSVAWPGVVLVIASSSLIGITITRSVPRANKFYIPGTMLPAERGP